MKCPFRKYTYTPKSNNRYESTEEHWMDCYGEDCTYYLFDVLNKDRHCTRVMRLVKT